MGPAFEDALAELRYGAIGVNIWSAAAFLIPEATWGAYPGHTEDDIQSGIGVVRNSLMFDRPQKTVARGSFYPFPRSWLHGDPSIAPKPPWFVTNRTANRTARLVTGVAVDPQLMRLPAIFALALRG
jgi:aldehyde dehydrogenase (NAD(P)+)